MKKIIKIISILTIFIVISCSNKDEKFYQSKLLNNHKLIEIDSLTYYNNDSLFISQTGDIKVWKDYILISDFNFMKLWVFDKKLNLIKTIGRKGNGPGEFIYPPVILTNNDSLLLFNMKLKKANLYDSNFNFIREIKIAKEKDFPSYSPITINGKFIFFYLEPESMAKVEYYKKYNSLAVLDENMQFIKSCLPWDNYYTKNLAYAFENAKVFLASGPGKNFIALQGATYKIHIINENLEQINVFGSKPKYFKEPPTDVTFEQTQRSIEAGVDFNSRTTKFIKIDFDSVSNYFFTNYVNLDKDFFYQRTLLLGRHYLQVYNSNYDCIFDGEIPGKLAFVTNGKIYILTDERPEYIKFKIFRLEKS